MLMEPLKFEDLVEAGSLHDWFNKSKSKDGKPGWVQSDGSPCANEKGEKKTPKCYSSQRLAGLKKTAEGRKKIRSADSRKSRQDPGQQQKSGAAKPTYVRTFKDSKDLKKHPSGDKQTDKKESVEYNKTFEHFIAEEKLLNKMANDLQYAQKQTKNPFRNKSVDQQAVERKAAAQDVSKAGKFQDHNKTVKAFQKNIEPVGTKPRGMANFGKFIATAPATTAMRGRV